MSDIEIGCVTAASGLRGEMRIKSFAESPERFRKVKELIFIKNSARMKCAVEHARLKGDLAVVKVEGIDTRDDSERMRGASVYMAEEELEDLPEGEFYVRDLIGMEVVERGGRRIGALKNVLTDRPQDLYVVEKPDGGELLIPAVDEFVKNIDAAGKVITVELIEGME